LQPAALFPRALRRRGSVAKTIRTTTLIYRIFAVPRTLQPLKSVASALAFARVSVIVRRHRCLPSAQHPMDRSCSSTVSTI